MIFDTIKPETTFKVEAENLNVSRIPSQLGSLSYNPTKGYEIFIDKKLYKIEILDKSTLNDIDYFIKNKNLTPIVHIIESVRDKYFTMEIMFFFYPTITTSDKFYISLDDKILDKAIEKQMINKNQDIKDLQRKLKEAISFEINGEFYFLVSTASSSYDDVWDKDDKEMLKNELAFTVHGENLHLPIKRNIQEDGSFQFDATKLKRFSNEIKRDNLRLLKADIEFKSGLVSEKIANDLEDILESDKSYLKTWDDYARIEGEILLKKAQIIGVLELKNITPIDNGYELRFESLPKELTEQDTISFVDEKPAYLDENIGWNEYTALLDNEQIGDKKNELEFLFNIEKKESNFITIKTDKNISSLKAKKAILSIYGSKVQIERRLRARELILTGKSANPHLGLIIEDSDQIKKYLNPNKNLDIIEPISDDILNKIFGTEYPPTQNQKEAISIALNTPDIAIIQGPPGTGKTTVITAIIERLNELSDKTKSIKGEILVTGFQHDAVENIISRLTINSLPPVKFGKKSTTIVDMDSYGRIMKWANGITEKLKPKLSNQLMINELDKYIEIYVASPSEQNSKMLLEHIAKLPQSNEKIVKKVSYLLNAVNNKKVDNLENMKNIYALRTTKITFLDDGKARVKDLLYSEIGEKLSDDEKNVLLDVENIHNDEDIDLYLKDLIGLRNNLIERLYPKTLFKVEKPNEEILDLIDEVREKLKEGKTKKDHINKILSDYINELENNPFELQEMIREYSFVFSSTTQQSDGKDITNAKIDDFYDTVIVDEAARVAPMDLLIPMVKAKKRIILVGDHRQLPHIVDDDLIKNSELNENDMIKKSMFQYLKDRVKKLENMDGVKRTITLNKQYRTHPRLGQFVSDNFYEKHGEAFKSPLPADNFSQALKGIENIANVWIDVPNTQCREVNAWKRECEASEIIKYMKKWILSEEGKTLTFGVITFYRDQVNTIKREFEKNFTLDEKEMIKDRYKIGTVDSFQGMEFDIVFLSIVRSKKAVSIKKDTPSYKTFGFLISKNRLCVSMSRQKKSLIVVGDKELYDSKIAQDGVEEIYEYLQLCKTEGKIL